MSSGYSPRGGSGRCFALWADFVDCRARSKYPEDCRLYSEDYMECLHREKESKRNEAVREGVEVVNKMSPEELSGFKSRFVQRYRSSLRERNGGAEVDDLDHLSPQARALVEEQEFNELQKRFGSPTPH